MTTPPEPRARVLIIEDDPASLLLMEYLLKAFGCETLAAQDGSNGLQIATRERLDLVVCDIRLPSMSGYDVVREMKSRPELRRLPIIAVTAYAMVGDREKALAAGFDDYIPKPIEPESFINQVRGHLPPHLRIGVQASTEASGKKQEKPEKRGEGISLLAVDDRAEPIEFLRSVLEPYGYTIVAATGVQNALAVARQSVPDLIITDLHMQDGTGYDLINALGEDASLKKVPILLVSATYGDVTPPAGLAPERVKVLSGAIEPQELLDAVASRATRGNA